MLKPTDAYSIVLMNKEAIIRLEAEADAWDWPLEQLRKGRTPPITTLIELGEMHQKSARSTAGALFLNSTLHAEAHRPKEVAPVVPWWRRLLYRAFRARA